jgi:hypothetical protein
MTISFSSFVTPGASHAARSEAILQLEGGNPELLQMAHYFASAHENYLGTMQGFALLYAALLIQSAADGLSVH